jgi:hypothetical protein
MSNWVAVADTNSSPSTALKVVLKKGEPEIFRVSDNIPGLVAYSTNYLDQNKNDLDIGYSDAKGNWLRSLQSISYYYSLVSK